jgi:AraC family transcriptional regulator, regulatory protein of adaptative response / DNA-3-methyladenine glycosylase II
VSSASRRGISAARWKRSSAFPPSNTRRRRGSGEYAQTKRLALAKQLLHDTKLPLADVAFASGFGSIRRFNALFKKRFSRAPSDVRSKHRAPLGAAGGARDGDLVGSLALRLDYRPPLAWQAMLGFLRGRAIRGVEVIGEDSYRRTVRIGDDIGWVSVTHAGGDVPALVAHVSMSLAKRLTTVVSRLRVLFDLDAQPQVIAEHLAKDAKLRRLVAKQPGLRLPGAFDPFEMAVRAVLGQQVSVKGATTLCGRLVDTFGTPVKLDEKVDDPDLRALFPTAAELARVPVSAIRSIGLPEARARTITTLANAVASGRVDLTGGAGPEATIAELETLPGIGPWTAHYLAMRAMHWPDAFVAGDLGVKKALGTTGTRAAEERAASWSPWRAYAVMFLWSSLSEGGQ